MNDFDLTIRGGRIVTASEDFVGDIGIKDGRIAAVASQLPAGKRDIQAAGKLVMPGGIDSHAHVEQLSSMGIMCADTWHTATVSAAYGGNTTIIPFAAQHRGQSLMQIARDYEKLAAPQAVIDYSYHLIMTDPTPEALNEHLPVLVREGITSFKVFMTYEKMKLNDKQLLDVFAVAAREGALPMVHAENDDVISWIARKLIEAGYTAPKYHAVAHDVFAEDEATNRAAQLSRVLEVPVVIVHVSSAGGARVIHSAKTMGASVHGETCPQYLVLTADDIDLPGTEGAKFCCSPPPRDPASQQAMWESLASGNIALFSSDHAPYRYDVTGKLPHGDDTTFKQISNGLPGLETRMPILFSEGVKKGRITLNQFVALTSTNHAKMYGLYPRKGTIAPGADADIAIWDADKQVTVTADMLHDNVGYTPYEGRQLTGWPETVISRGDVIIDKGTLNAEAGRGWKIPRGTPEPVANAKQPGERASFLRKLFDTVDAKR